MAVPHEPPAGPSGGANGDTIARGGAECGVAPGGNGERLVVTDAHQQPMLDLLVSELRSSWDGGFCRALDLPAAPASP